LRRMTFSLCARRLERRVCDPCAVARPAGYIERSVAREEARDLARSAAFARNQPQQIISVGRMAGVGRNFAGKKNDPLPIGRRMREPIVVVVVCHLLLVRSISVHAPDLKTTRARGMKINKFSIG